MSYIFILLCSLIVFTQTGCKTYVNSTSRKEEFVKSYFWNQLNAANVGYTNFVIIEPNSPNILYSAPNVGGIYKSYDYGQNWKPLNKGLNWPADRLVAALTIDPVSTSIYLGVGGFGKGGIFKSTDGGESWQLLTRKVVFNGVGIEQTRGNGLIVLDPKDNKTIYAGSSKDGVFKSIDAGETWSNIGLRGLYISSILINHVDQRVVYAASVMRSDEENGTTAGVYKSIDGGNKWERAGSIISEVYQMIMDPANPDVIYAACGSQGIMMTSDGGNNWSGKNKGLSELNQSIKYISLAIDPNKPEVIYAGTGEYRGQIYKSIDKGEHWVKLTTNSNNIYPDGWWIQKRNWPGGLSYSANSLSVAPDNGNRIYVSGRSGIWRSDDGGLKWTAKINGLEGACMLNIAVHPFNPDIFFIGEEDYLLFRTMDGGKTFERPLAGIGNWDLEKDKDISQKYKADQGLALAIDPRNDPFTMYVGTSGLPVNTGTIFKSTDGGETWKEANNGLPVASVTALAIDKTNYNILFAMLQEHGLYKTVDGGEIWRKVDIDVSINNNKMFQWNAGNLILIHPRVSDVIYVLDKKSGVYKSLNGGIEWEIISKSLPQTGISGMDRYTGGMALDTNDPDIVYLGLRNYGVYKTTDGGRKWGKITPPYILHGGAISIDPSDNSIYLVSIPASGEEDIDGFIPGIYKSNDDGKTWHAIHNDDLMSISMKARFLTAYKGKLYISTQGNGIIIGEPSIEKSN